MQCSNFQIGASTSTGRYLKIFTVSDSSSSWGKKSYKNMFVDHNSLGRQGLDFTFARSNNVLLFVEVVLVALDVAAATLQGRRRLEDVPQRLGAGLAVGREVI